MWIFGYGSLVWKADFPYTHKLIGYIKGYDRRFWQASIDHRGTPDKPGRVVTLVKSSNPEAKVWGVCYSVPNDDEQSISKLNEREKRFSQVDVEFFYNPSSSSKSSTDKIIRTTVYIGLENGPLYLGDAPVEEIASQIVGARGPSGENSEYIFKLAEFMRAELPGVDDPHLFAIEGAARVWGTAYRIDPSQQEQTVHHLDHREVMGYEKVPVLFHPVPNHPMNEIIDNDITCSSSSVVVVPFQVTMYYGSEENNHYVGEAPLNAIARQICECNGPSGSNKEYLFKLVGAMRSIQEGLVQGSGLFAHDDNNDHEVVVLDSHLADLEGQVKELSLNMDDNVISTSSS